MSEPIDRKYLDALFDDMIKEHALWAPDLSDGLKKLREKLADPAEPGIDKPKAIETLSKNLPAISKGIIAAKQAFEKGDDITGAAEIMNICSGIAPIIGAFTVAGGPAGMLIGAMFSVIGQVLALFAPRKESDVDKIEKLLLSMEAETIREKGETDLTSIRKAAEGMRHQATEAAKALANRKLVVHQDALNFQASIDIEKISIKEFKLIDGPTILNHWGVASWLKKPSRQDLDEWPEILGIYCQAYAELLHAYTTIIAFAYGADMRAAFDAVSPDSQNPLWSIVPSGETARDNCEQALLKLTEYAQKRLDDIRNCNETVLADLEKFTPVARQRGIFVCAASSLISEGTGSYNDYGTFVATGPRAFSESRWSRIYQHTLCMSFTPPSTGEHSPDAQYDLWVLDSYNLHGGRSKFDTRSRVLKLGTPLVITGADRDDYPQQPGGRFSDIAALPLGGDKFLVYGAQETRAWEQKSGALEGWDYDPNKRASGEFKRRNWRAFAKAPIVQVRAATPSATLLDDLDRDGMLDYLKGGSLIYGTLKGEREIAVFAPDAPFEPRYIPAPHSVYTGIAIDPYFLWMYGDHGFACTTHASVVSWIRGNNRYQVAGGLRSPLWMSSDRSGNHKGRVLALSSCEDRTILLSSPDGLFTSVYRTDLAAGILTVENWDKLVGGDGSTQVEKLPIFCWQLLEDLKAACADPGWQPPTAVPVR